MTTEQNQNEKDVMRSFVIGAYNSFDYFLVADSLNCLNDGFGGCSAEQRLGLTEGDKAAFGRRIKPQQQPQLNDNRYFCYLCGNVHNDRQGCV